MFLKIAHRGASGLEPENTLSAFKKALEYNLDMIECDVRFLKTGEAIVFHDKKTRRITGVRGKVKEMTFDQARELKVGGKEKIPTLDEVLDLIGRKVKVNIEVKDRRVDLLAKVIEERVNKGWSYQDFLVSSFNYSALRKMKILLPEVNLALNFRKASLLKFKKACKLGVYSVNITLKSAKKKFIKKAQRKGFKVFVWTVNQEKDIEKVLKRGVDGIFSDYPNKIC